MLLTKLGNLKSLVLGQYFPRPAEVTVTRGGGRYPRDRGQSATSPGHPPPPPHRRLSGPPLALPLLLHWLPGYPHWGWRVIVASSARGSTDLLLISIFLLLTASMLRWRTCLPSAEAEVIWGEASQGNAFPQAVVRRRFLNLRFNQLSKRFITFYAVSKHAMNTTSIMDRIINHISIH